MKNIPDKFVDKTKTRNLYSKISTENRVLYLIMWKNILDSDRPQMTI